MAVHTAEEVERLRDAGEQHVLGNHRVEGLVGEIAKIPCKVLIIVVEVLAYNLYIRVGQQLLHQERNLDLFFLGPVVTVQRHEGNAEGFSYVPGKADAGNAPGYCFYIDGELKGSPAGHLTQKHQEDSSSLGKGRADAELISGVVIQLGAFGQYLGALQVTDAEAFNRPLLVQGGWRVGRDDHGGRVFRGVVGVVFIGGGLVSPGHAGRNRRRFHPIAGHFNHVQQRPAPRIHRTIDAGQGEHGQIS